MWFRRKRPQTTPIERGSTFRTAEPIGRGTMTPEYVEALKAVGADPDLIRWAEARLKPAHGDSPPPSAGNLTERGS